MLRLLNDALMVVNTDSPLTQTLLIFTGLASLGAMGIVFFEHLVKDQKEQKEQKPMAHPIHKLMTKKELNIYLQKQHRHAQKIGLYSKRESQSQPGKKAKRMNFKNQEECEAAVQAEKERQAAAQEKENQRLAEATKAEQESKKRKLEAWLNKKNRGPKFIDSTGEISLTPSPHQEPPIQNRPG